MENIEKYKEIERQRDGEHRKIERWRIQNSIKRKKDREMEEHRESINIERKEEHRDRKNIETCARTTPLNGKDRF